MTPPEIPTSAFDYRLPEELIARYPTERRDESRLLVLRRDGGPVEHRLFRDLVEYVPPGDALVLNETRVLPARLVGRKPTGAAGEVLLLRPWAGSPPQTAGAPTGPPEYAGAPQGAGVAADEPRLWEALVRPGSKLKPGRALEIGADLTVDILEGLPGGHRLVRLRGHGPVSELLRRHGHIPLPPYIDREDEPLDRERYQTVYARSEGSVAAPTAGLHFTPALLDALEANGVRLVRLVLHVGPGTFRPVEVEDPAAHTMHAEWYRLDAHAAAELNEVRSSGGSIWAVGTTVVRTLESMAAPDGRARAGSGWTEIFIRPGYRFRLVDRLITNFHLPRSTLLMLVAAFAGHERVMESYRIAVERGYRFYSYGDAMVVL